MKKFSIFLLVLVILGALLYYFFPLEMIVKKAVNKYGSEVTNTSVNLSGFHLNLKDGEASVKEITIANPAGYKTKNAIELGNVDVKVDVKSVTTDTIVIDQIIINKPVVSYEMASLTKNNISDIINNISEYTAVTSSEPQEPEVVEEDAAAKKVIIKKVIISNGEINGAVTVAPDVVSAAIPLPTITLENIGQDSKGMTIGESIAFVLDKLLSSVSTTVISSNLSNLKDAANAAVDGAKETAGAAVDTAKETATGAVDSVKDTLSGLNPFGK